MSHVDKFFEGEINAPKFYVTQKISSCETSQVETHKWLSRQLTIFLKQNNILLLLKFIIN
jgi:hypothetical protein